MTTSYFVREGDREFSVELLSDDGSRATLRIDDTLFEVETRTLPSGAITVQSEQARGVWRAWKDNHGQHLTAGGDDRCYEVLDELSRWQGGGKGESGQREGRVLASMPGRVVTVPVSVGDTVAEGDVVAVLEAMKMENDVRAPTSGVVTEIAAKAGDGVESGQLLVLIQAPD